MESPVTRWLKNSFYLSVLLSVLPLIVSAVIVLKTHQKLKIFLLSKRFHNLEVVETEVMGTTFGLNLKPEIVKCVLKIRGRHQLNDVQSRYEKFMKTLGQNSRLKMPMTSCWAHPAFIKNYQTFDIKNHIFLSPPTFKASPINEFNIQDCVNFWLNEILPSDVPQWQVMLIPPNNENILYVLIKVHNLLLKEKNDLNDVLKPLKGLHILTQQVFNEPISLRDFLLTKWMDPPVNSIALYENLVIYLADLWNNFVYKHDSLERHEGTLKAPESLSDLATSLVMVLYNTHRQYNQSKRDTVINLWLSLARAESERWQLSWLNFTKILIDSVNPINIFKEFLKICWWVMIQCSIKLPLKMLCELETIHAVLFLNEPLPISSVIGISVKYIPLAFGSLKEIIQLVSLAFNAPRLIFEGSK